MDRETVKQVCELLQEEFRLQAKNHFSRSAEHCDSFKRSKNPQHVWDTLRLHFGGKCLDGLADKIRPEWIAKLKVVSDSKKE